jgi:8-oxo-dGTP pyrophosphatase MutT (NUDIX family)
MAEEHYRRRAARVLVVNGAGQLLLFRFEGEAGHCWLTPGGGVEDGEALTAAAARELLEETGLRVGPDELGSPVAVSSGHAEFSWASGVFRDDFFFLRTDGHEVDTGALTAFERTKITGHRWWSVEELASTTEVVYPFGLVPLLGDLLAGRLPDAPVRLPWHHDVP